MTEKYILVSDDEYCYTLDTSDENYKTLEDFEKQEFENAKHDGIDIKDYEDAILEKASDNYWDWVYNNHLEADTVNDIINKLAEENEQLKKGLNECNRIKTKRTERMKNQRKALNDMQEALWGYKGDIKSLKKENEELKKENQELKNYLLHMGYKTIYHDGHISLEQIEIKKMEIKNGLLDGWIE